MKRVRRNYINNRKTLGLLIIVFVTVFMSVGFSILNQRLQLVGNTNLYASEKYLWHKILNDYGTNTQSGIIANENEANKYSYVGNNPNNYITFNNEPWRIVSIESDNTIKIVKLSNNINIAYDETGNRTETSTYCTNLDKGCNAWSQKSILTNNSVIGNIDNNSTINEYLNTTFYNSLSNESKSKIVEHNYNVGAVTSGNDLMSIIAEEIQQTWSGNVGTLSISELMYATNASFNLGNTSPNNSYIGSITNGSIVWTMSMLNDNSNQVWTYGPTYTDYSLKDANLTNETINEVSYNYIVLPVVHLSHTVEYNSGTGTIDNPFTIK